MKPYIKGTFDFPHFFYFLAVYVISAHWFGWWVIVPMFLGGLKFSMRGFKNG
jgi:hypothetical protein